VLNAVVRVCFEAVPVMVINTVAETSPVIVSIIVFATVPGKVVTRVAATLADSQRETIPPWPSSRGFLRALYCSPFGPSGSRRCGSRSSVAEELGRLPGYHVFGCCAKWLAS
jgi:hypothetical protein